MRLKEFKNIIRFAMENEVEAQKFYEAVADKLQDPHLKDMFLEVVAEKTGYPKDVLQMDMDMESNLGIDSIKRVEILSEMQQQLPQLGAIEPSNMAELSTLGHVLQTIEQLIQGELTEGSQHSTDAPRTDNGADVTELFLNIVA